jgi:hypothetical protein
MADIKYLAGLDIDGNINLNTNQLQFAVIQPDTSDPTAQTPQVGQIYYKSDSQSLRIYTGPTDGWISVGQDSNNYVKSGTFNDSNGQKKFKKRRFDKGRNNGFFKIGGKNKKKKKKKKR